MPWDDADDDALPAAAVDSAADHWAVGRRREVEARFAKIHSEKLLGIVPKDYAQELVPVSFLFLRKLS